MLAVAVPVRLRFGAHLLGIHKPLTVIPTSSSSTRCFFLFPSPPPRNVSLRQTPRDLFRRNVSQTAAPAASDSVSVSFPKDSPLFVSFLNRVWKHVVQKGDTVIDATCGNGHDTLAMLKMVADESGKGSVYGLDIQEAALQKTSSLLEDSVTPNEKGLVKLFSKCHSKMHEVLPRNTSVRLVAFNLGYLPWGDKTLTTRSDTTLKALEAAKGILMDGGLISLVVYVGHPGGWEELKTVQDFITKLPVETWICSEFQTVNRSWSPVLVFIFKRC
ncbi:tRNA (mnm(5)s(2)U34)-methyltransferase, chloroplastic isoform X2 [Pyrus communis]|uniref:tRNA (mnm(5)s(2)U34)-methyltransferase, chloroplastic isoform X2 n=1 Tax=Pyrus communis TaxID=23211 RepID=UPI0035C0AA70